MGKPAPAPKPKPVGKPAPPKPRPGKPAPAPKPKPVGKPAPRKPVGKPAPPKKAPTKKAASAKGEAKPGGKGEVTRATNLMRARKCQELLTEWQKAYASSIPIEKDKRYHTYYNDCKKKGTPIPNGPKPK